MEVIGAGWGRTGTLSLKTALEQLGYRCYHMVDVLLKHSNHAEMWRRAADGDSVDFNSMLAGYTACVDWPTVSFYKELLQQHPDAKVVLTVRDPGKWCNSMTSTVYQVRKILKSAPWYVAKVLNNGGPARGMAMIEKLIYEDDFQGHDLETEPEQVQQLFLQHIEEVKQVVPADRLLVFEVHQGWEPLCTFLGKPVPEVPFPHVNDTQGWQRQLAAIKRTISVLTYVLPAAAAAAVAALAASLLAVQRRAQRL